TIPLAPRPQPDVAILELVDRASSWKTPSWTSLRHPAKSNHLTTSHRLDFPRRPCNSYGSKRKVRLALNSNTGLTRSPHPTMIRRLPFWHVETPTRSASEEVRCLALAGASGWCSKLKNPMET